MMIAGGKITNRIRIEKAPLIVGANSIKVTIKYRIHTTTVITNLTY